MKLKKKIKLILKNLPKFWKKEEEEIEELIKGKKTFKKFRYDFSFIFKDFFLPGHYNNFQPKILRTKFLTTIVILLILLKAIFSFSLLFVYPNLALMSEDIASKIYQITNEDRIAHNLLSLKLNNSLSKIAFQKANDMLIRNYFAHKDPDNKMIWDLLDRTDYPYVHIGENLGMNFVTAELVNEALMKSPMHRKNILNENFQDIGIAVVSRKINNKRTNILVQVFADKEIKQDTDNLKTIKREVKNVPVVSLTELKEKEPTKVLLVETTTKEKRPQKIIKNTSTNIALKKGEAKNSSSSIALQERQNKRIKPSSSVGYVENNAYKNGNLVIGFMDWSRLIFKIVLTILFFALLLNIFVEITIQHKSVIFQTIFVLIIIVILLSAKISFVESISQNIKLL